MMHVVGEGAAKGLLGWLGPLGQAPGDICVGHREMRGALGEWGTRSSLLGRQCRDGDTGRETAASLTQMGPPGP